MLKLNCLNRPSLRHPEEKCDTVLGPRGMLFESHCIIANSGTICGAR